MPKAVEQFEPYWQSADGNFIRLWHGDVLQTLRRMPSKAVQCAVTSPPYWGLRSYSTGDNKHLELGCERTPEEFIGNMVMVFVELRRVLRDDGVLWLNLGDTYCAGNNRNGLSSSLGGEGRKPNNPDIGDFSTGMASGNLVGVPWRVALALQADGWVLRSDLPWVKRSAMPESVQNRPAKSLEYFFMLTKVGSGYFFDMEAIRRPSVKGDSNAGARNYVAGSGRERLSQTEDERVNGRAFRNSDLWFESIEAPYGVVGIGDELVGLDKTSEAYSGAHFATFGTRLITPLILSSTSERGACTECGAPWRRVMEEVDNPAGIMGKNNNRRVGSDLSIRSRDYERESEGFGKVQLGWEPTCRCGCDVVRPCIVLDPFMGSGTTAQVCIQSKPPRWCWGVELSEKYLDDNAIPRITAALDSVPRMGEFIAPPRKPPRAAVPLELKPIQFKTKR